jgi:type II secretory ATPase GspE/PulE/Tfp pilus assembly ATPase PilB-like protein
LVLNDELRGMIASRAPILAIKDAARTAGTLLLRESAEDMVRAGLTSQTGINRVTFARDMA